MPWKWIEAVPLPAAFPRTPMLRIGYAPSAARRAGQGERVELTPDARGKDIMRLATSASDIGRSIIAPPSLPPDRAAALRHAFEQLVTDSEFTAESARGAASMSSRCPPPPSARSWWTPLACPPASSMPLRAITEVEK